MDIPGYKTWNDGGYKNSRGEIIAEEIVKGIHGGFQKLGVGPNYDGINKLLNSRPSLESYKAIASQNPPKKEDKKRRDDGYILDLTARLRSTDVVMSQFEIILLNTAILTRTNSEYRKFFALRSDKEIRSLV